MIMKRANRSEFVAKIRMRPLQAQRRALALMAVSDIARVSMQSDCTGTTSPSETDLPAPGVIDVVDASHKLSVEERGMAEGMLSTTVRVRLSVIGVVHMLVLYACCGQLHVASLLAVAHISSAWQPSADGLWAAPCYRADTDSELRGSQMTPQGPASSVIRARSRSEAGSGSVTVASSGGRRPLRCLRVSEASRRLALLLRRCPTMTTCEAPKVSRHSVMQSHPGLGTKPMTLTVLLTLT